MHTLLIFGLAVSAALQVEAAPDVKERTAATVKLCSEKFGLSKEMVETMKDQSRLPENDTEKCYLECLFEGVGLVVDGKLNEEGAKELAKSKYSGDKDMMDKAMKTLDHCLKEYKPHPTEQCYYGYYIRNCVKSAGYGLTLF